MSPCKGCGSPYPESHVIIKPEHLNDLLANANVLLLESASVSGCSGLIIKCSQCLATFGEEPDNFRGEG